MNLVILGKRNSSIYWLFLEPKIDFEPYLFLQVLRPFVGLFSLFLARWLKSNNRFGFRRPNQVFAQNRLTFSSIHNENLANFFLIFVGFYMKTVFFHRNWKAVLRSTTVLGLILPSEFKSAVKFELSQSVRKL